MAVEKINPDTLARPVLDLYAQIVVSSAPRLAFISGQVALDERGVLIGRDHATQARQAFRNLRLALEAVGAQPHDITKMTLYVAGHKPELIDPIFAAGRAEFGAQWPLTASVLIGVQTLGLPEWLIEIDAVAALDP
jgi:enamine deaminase RidA (YjgF/YER057c/UK114 family)